MSETSNVTGQNLDFSALVSAAEKGASFSALTAAAANAANDPKLLSAAAAANAPPERIRAYVKANPDNPLVKANQHLVAKYRGRDVVRYRQHQPEQRLLVGAGRRFGFSGSSTIGVLDGRQRERLGRVGNFYVRLQGHSWSTPRRSRLCPNSSW